MPQVPDSHILPDRRPELESSERFANRLRALLFGTIRNKIIIPFLFVTLIVTMLGTFIVTRLLATNAQDRLTNQLLEVSRATSDSMVNWEQYHLDTLRLTVFSIGVPEALETSDTQSLTLALTALAANQDAYLLMGIGRDGAVITDVLRKNGSLQTGLLANQNLNSVPTIERVVTGVSDERGDKFAEIVNLNGELVMLTVAPAHNTRSELVGAVAIGTPIEQILIETKAAVLADLILYQPSGEALHTTLVLAGETDLDSLDISPELYQEALAQADTATRLQGFLVNRREYQAAFIPMEVRGRQLGVLGVVYPSSMISSIITTNRSGMTILFSLIAGLVVILGYVIAANLSTPIRRLALTAQAVRAGDLDQQSGVRTADEIGILGRVFDDMTVRLSEQTATLQELYEEQEKEAAYLAAVIASSADGTVVVSMDGMITRLNPVAQESIRRNENLWLHVLSEVMSNLLKEEGGQKRVEVDAAWYDVVAAMIRNTRDEQIGVVITLRDVTEQVLTDRMRTAFILQMSHELYTPLTAIKGYTELAYKVLENVDTRARDFLPLAINNAATLNQMIAEMLDVAQLMRGGLEIVLDAVDLSTLVDDVVGRLNQDALERALGLEAHLRPGLLLQADPGRLTWAISHLVSNAVNFTLPGGRVAVYTGRQDSCAVLRVMDTGVGIPPHELPHIFEQFYRGQPVAPDGTVIDIRGTGLGLFIVDQVVKAHGGSVEVHSQPGKGSEFTIRLPLAEATARAHGPQGLTA